MKTRWSRSGVCWTWYLQTGTRRENDYTPAPWRAIVAIASSGLFGIGPNPSYAAVNDIIANISREGDRFLKNWHRFGPDPHPIAIESGITSSLWYPPSISSGVMRREAKRGAGLRRGRRISRRRWGVQHEDFTPPRDARVR
jgi:hypothetical protein